jgi:hypothetical protein
MQTSRRSFLKIGLAGALTLAAGGLLYRQFRAAPQQFQLDDEGRSMLAAVIPVMLGPVLPSGAERAASLQDAIEQVRLAILGLPLAVQKEVQDLFGLMALAPTRRLLAGIPPWSEASPQQVAEFLQSWRQHRLALLQSAYHALHDLIIGSWYAQPAHWAAIGYPGPMKELSV